LLFFNQKAIIMKKIYWGLTLLIGLPLLAIVAINAFDEKLDPRAAAWGEPRKTAVPEAENAYYALVAMGAPDGGDGPAYARAWLAEARTAAKEKRNETQPVVKRASRPDVCKPALASCLNAAREKGAELATALDAYKEDLARYRTLIAAGRFEEVLDYPMRINATLPAYNETARAQRAWLTQAALAAEAGNLEDAIATVERDMAFYRVMLGGARTLIGKMSAARGYWTDLAFMADLMQQKSAALEPMMPRVRAMLNTIDPAALRMDSAMEGEFGVMKHLFRSPEGAPDFTREVGLLGSVGIKVLYKPNATINRAYRSFVAMTDALNQPPAGIAPAWRKAVEPMTELRAWDYIDNPIAKILLSIALPDLHQYALRLHDLDAFNRLVTLRADALAAHVSTGQAAEFAAQSDVKLHDPYTGKPMVWNAAKTRFQFKPLGATAAQFGFNVDKEGAYVAY
jgi:hypothetical protein